MEHFLLRSPSHKHANKSNSIFLSSSHFLHFGIFAENLQRARAGFNCFMIHQPFGSFNKDYITTVSRESTIPLKLTSMEDRDWSFSKHCWAKIPCSFIIWSLKQHLFQQYTTKQLLFYHCPPNLVRSRISPFAICWYASYRSLCHDCCELWVDENGWIFWELQRFKVWLSFVFVHGSSILARVNEIGRWIIDVCGVLVRMLCLFSISGQKCSSRFWWWWTVQHKP